MTQELKNVDVKDLRRAKPPEEEFERLAASGNELTCESAAIVVTDISDVEGMKRARDCRLMLRDIRIRVEKKHKELKEYYLTGGRRIDQLKNALVSMIEPEEARLLACEQFVERDAARRRAALESARRSELAPYEFPGAAGMVLAGLLDHEWDDLLVSARDMQVARQVARQVAERARQEAAAIEAAKAREQQEREQEERARLRAENIRLREAVVAEELKAMAAPSGRRTTPQDVLLCAASLLPQFSGEALYLWKEAIDRMKRAEEIFSQRYLF